jgi:hypothetical protein
MSATERRAARRPSPISSEAQVTVRASASRTAGAASGGIAKPAPSPPKTKGNCRPPVALSTAAITAAPTMFTVL